ncbi:MAG: bifunctional folylpolyglutamate synthase/dihydrofolate synthase [Tannerella sp.]|nr:bifunctional folylpolyglutamate synthase/dihydrofolate synthase [Tannerella sp.]
MTYEETLNYLYSCTPAFHQVGAVAYKPGLERSMALDDQMDNPHRSYQTIHVAGTNGKGSVAHLLAAILREANFKVGLYTSPHLVDFCERIRMNGRKMPKHYLVDFVKRHQSAINTIRPSFFELTSSLAFEFFRHKKVDIAVIETGLGGRLDSTNIIRPILSIITNISLDHTQYLGKTLNRIAEEKAGIIKPGVPVVIGEIQDKSVYQVFIDKAATMKSPVYFAEKEQTLINSKLGNDGKWAFTSSGYGYFTGELGGMAQLENAQTVLTAIRMLRRMGLKIPKKDVGYAFEHVIELTGLMGRWQTLQKKPLVICDTGHNEGAWEKLKLHLEQTAEHHPTLRMVVGMVSDKDIHAVLSLMPQKAVYYFTQASDSRALPVKKFAAMAQQHALTGNSYRTVAEAVQSALNDAQPDDLIFIGGSTFVVADAIPKFT